MAIVRVAQQLAASCATPGGKRAEQVADNCRDSELPLLTEETMAQVRRIYDAKIPPLFTTGGREKRLRCLGGRLPGSDRILLPAFL